MMELNVPRNSKSNVLVAAKSIIKAAKVMLNINKRANNVALITSAMISATLKRIQARKLIKKSLEKEEG